MRYGSEDVCNDYFLQRFEDRFIYLHTYVTKAHILDKVKIHCKVVQVSTLVKLHLKAFNFQENMCMDTVQT